MYYLLPFRFHVFRDQELLTNDLGDYLLVPRGSVQRIVDREVLSEEELYKDLVASFFISEKPLPRLIDTMAVRLATRKAFLDHFTALHIFVLTLRCNQNCIYCQASSQESCRNEYDMSEQTLLHAVDLMFCSPSPSLTMEFQGGEPTLVPHLIRRAIEYAEEKNRTENREITYVVCTNRMNCSICANDTVQLSRPRSTARSFCTTTTEGKRTAISALLPELRRLAKNWAKAGFPH